MYKYNKIQATTINRNTSYQGERIEEKINRIVNNKEPITDGAPLIYTERKHGVQPEYNPKTDRFEIAIDAMDKVTKAHLAKREQNIKNFEKKMDKANEKIDEKRNKPTGEKDGGPESAQTTENK